MADAENEASKAAQGTAASSSKKVYREKTFEVGLGLDNALRASFNVGLNYYVVDEKKPPIEWPLLCVSCDEGSDGKAMLYALQSARWNLNIVGRFDPNHGL